MALSVGIQEFTVTYVSKVQTLSLSLSSSSHPSHTVSLRSCWMCFIHFTFFYSAQHPCSIYFVLLCYFCLSRRLSSSHFLPILPSCLTEFNLKVRCGLLCWVFDAVLGIRIWFYCHNPHNLFPLSFPTCLVCLSVLVLMDLSVVGLQHVLPSRMSLVMICISLVP